MKFVIGAIIGVFVGILIALGIFLSLSKEEPAKQERTPVKTQEETAPVLKASLDMSEVLDRNIELNPNDSNAYLQKADYLAKKGKLQEALDYYNKAILLDKDNTQAYMNRGAVHYMLNNFEAAKKDFSTAINLDATKGETFFNRALSNLNLGSYPEAKNDFKQAATLFNKAADKKSFEQARQGYKATSALIAQEKDNNIPKTNIPKGQKPSKQNQSTPNKASASSNEELTKQYTSQLMTSLSNPEGMLEKFKEAQKRAGGEPGVMPDFESYAASMREQAGQKFQQVTAKKTYLDYKDEAYKKQSAGDMRGALEAINKAIELNAEDPELYKQRAQINMSAKEPNAAIADYTKALSLNPKDASSLYNRALLRDMISDKKGAREDMTQAENLYKEQGDKGGQKQARETLNLWDGKEVNSPRQDKDFTEGANAFNKGNYKEALNSWDNLIKKYPNEASGYYNRAITNARLNDSQAAERDYRKAIELNPSMAEAYDGLSSILVSKGKNDEALQYINKSLKINPDNPDAYRMRAIANVRDNPNQALSDFSKAISYNDQDAVSYYYRGILKGNTNLQAGKDDLKHALRLAQEQGNQQIIEAAQTSLDRIEEYQRQGN